LAIFGQNLLDKPDNEAGYRELTGLAGQKPWECVGEILEAAACLHRLLDHPDWQNDALIERLGPDLLAQYGVDRLQIAWTDFNTDSAEHHVPADLAAAVASHAA